MKDEMVTEALCDKGRRLLFVQTVTPLLSEHPEIESFYRDLADSCRRFCRETLFPRLCDKETETDVFGYLYRYSFLVCVTYADPDFLACRLSVSLKNEKAGEKCMRFEDAQVFSLASGRILSPKEILRKFASRDLRKQCRRGGGALLPEAGCLKQWQNGAWRSLGTIIRSRGDQGLG